MSHFDACSFFLVYLFMTHPASWDGTADVRLVSKILISDVVFRADQNTAGPVRTTRDWTERSIQWNVFHVKIKVKAAGIREQGGLWYPIRLFPLTTSMCDVVLVNWC